MDRHNFVNEATGGGHHKCRRLRDDYPSSQIFQPFMKEQRKNTETALKDM
jgi:hypothetical protein